MMVVVGVCWVLVVMGEEEREDMVCFRTESSTKQRRPIGRETATRERTDSTRNSRKRTQSASF